ncbi:hypothetical protein CP8484711_1212A, partial [Chlamydia psittaci 84-8471/1]
MIPDSTRSGKSLRNKSPKASLTQSTGLPETAQ